MVCETTLESFPSEHTFVFKTVKSAEEIINAYASGESIVFHLHADNNSNIKYYFISDDVYLSLLGFDSDVIESEEVIQDAVFNIATANSGVMCSAPSIFITEFYEGTVVEDGKIAIRFVTQT